MKSLRMLLASSLLALTGIAHAGVLMYTQDGCEPCEQSKQELRAAGVKFGQCNISRSEACQEQFDRLGGEGTPLLVVNGKVLQYYTADQVKRMVGGK